MSLSHINENGEANMVDTSGKEVTARIATASGKVTMKAEALNAIASGQTPKGDVLATARLAGIMGAKKTSELIPLCHQIALNKVEIELRIESDGVAILATAKTTDRTGVEMEALTAVQIALLTIYDMLKAVDRGMTITDVKLLEKHGGKSGSFVANK